MQSTHITRSTAHAIGPAQAMIATLACTLSYQASADTYSHYVDENTHGYIVENMPDFDQRRVFLPNTGDCYCGPAAAADLMGYISTHGFPDVEPGPPVTSWSDRDDYNDLSRLLLDLGTGITSPEPKGSTATSVASPGAAPPRLPALGRPVSISQRFSPVAASKPAATSARFTATTMPPRAVGAAR